MPPASGPSAFGQKITPAAAMWQDAADDEEWSAWADGATQQSASLMDEQDGFGAWVDSSDPNDSLHFPTPSSSPYMSSNQVEQQDPMPIPNLGDTDRPQLEAYALRKLKSQTSSTPSEHVNILYSNPWNDDHPVLDKRKLQEQHDYDDDGDMDPEIDSALASSAWESVLAEDTCSTHDDSDDEVSTFEAWDIGEHSSSQELAEDKKEFQTSEARVNDSFHDTSVEINAEERSDSKLEWYNTDYSTVTGTEVRQPTWMQRLTGNRSKQAIKK